MTTDVLDKLEDIVLPPAPGWWPPAPGYYLLAALLLILLIAGGRLLWRRYQNYRRYRSWLEQLEAINPAQHDACQQINLWLKRVALSCHPRQQVAALHQQQWANWLLQAFDKPPVEPDTLLQWLQSAYRVPTPEAGQKFHQFARHWLRACYRRGCHA